MKQICVYHIPACVGKTSLCGDPVEVSDPDRSSPDVCINHL